MRQGVNSDKIGFTPADFFETPAGNTADLPADALIVDDTSGGLSADNFWRPDLCFMARRSARRLPSLRMTAATGRLSLQMTIASGSMTAKTSTIAAPLRRPMALTGCPTIPQAISIRHLTSPLLGRTHMRFKSIRLPATLSMQAKRRVSTPILSTPAAARHHQPTSRATCPSSTIRPRPVRRQARHPTVRFWRGLAILVLAPLMVDTPVAGGAAVARLRPRRVLLRAW